MLICGFIIVRRPPPVVGAGHDPYSPDRVVGFGDVDEYRVAGMSSLEVRTGPSAERSGPRRHERLPLRSPPPRREPPGRVFPSRLGYFLALPNVLSWHCIGHVDILYRQNAAPYQRINERPATSVR